MCKEIITRDQLRHFSDDTGPLYVACQGVVYDVSNCERWKRGIHEGLHFPGQDLTEELKEAPHGIEVFSYPRVIRVAKLSE